MNTLNYKGIDVYIQFELNEYKNAKIVLLDYKTNAICANVTFDDFLPLPFGLMAVSCTGENFGMNDWLKENSIIEPEITIYRTEFGQYIFSLNLSTLKTLDEDGTDKYFKAHNMKNHLVQKFDLGKIVITNSAQMKLTPLSVGNALVRHINNDWGECGVEDWKQNDDAVISNETIHSVYKLDEKKKFYVITERDRSCTTILMPEDY